MSLLSVSLATFAALMLVASLRSLQGTTLVAAVAWAIFALTALTGAELAAAWSPSADWLPHLRLLAAGTTFCPLMALFGAKRPQDRGWQFVVLSLWGLVAFYGLTELAYRPHRPPELHPAVRWLLVAPLVGMGLVNHLFTRYAIPAILVAIGQIMLLSPELPEIHLWLPASLVVGPQAGDAAALTGIAFLLSAVGLAIALAQYGGSARHTSPTRKRGSDAQEAESSPTFSTGDLTLAAPSLARRASVNPDLADDIDPAFDRVWLDFRDEFGTFWGLRVVARFNQTAEQLGWVVRLTWHGLKALRAIPDGAPIDDPKRGEARIQPAARHVLESLLLRFVDADWLARRREGRAAHPAQGQGGR